MFHWLQTLLHALRANPPAVVPVLRLSGPIGVGGRVRQELNLADMASVIQRAFRMPGVKAVALAVNSPGGAPVQSALIMQRIRDLAEEKDVPVIVFAEDVAASGGYLLALAGDEIYAHEASVVGSIGVVFASFGFPAALEKLGVERRLYTAGDKKAMMDPFSPTKDDDEKRLKHLQTEIHEYFKSVVMQRRGRKLKGAKSTIFSGDVWLGEEAVKLGLVDGIGQLRPVLRERFGENVKIRLIEQKKPRLSKLFGMFSRDRDGFDSAGASFASDMLATIEARLMWSRWGL